MSLCRVVHVGVIGYCLLLVIAAHAQTIPRTGSAASDEPLRFRRLLIPEELIPSRFPNYRPIKRDNFESEVERINARVKRASQALAQVMRANYRARLSGNDLLVGEATLDVVHRVGEPTVLPLVPCSVSVGHLHWSDDEQDVVSSGSVSSGEFLAIIDREGALQFKWSTRGTVTSRGVRAFTFSVPRCAASRLTLELPPELVPRTARGIVVTQSASTPVITGNPVAGPVSGAALQIWELEFGGHSDIELQLVPRTNPDTVAGVLLREFTRYRMATSGVELRSTCQLDSDRQQIDRLSLSISPGLSVAAAQIGGQSLTLAQQTGPQGESLVEVVLGEPLVGVQQELVVVAYAPLVTGKIWELPRVRPAGILWQEGQAVLEVVEPLSLGAVEIEDGIEATVEPLPLPEVGESRRIQFWSPQGQAKVLLSYPPLEVEADLGTSIRFSELAATARLVVDLQAKRGSSFEISGLVMRGWTIDSVQSDPPEVLDRFSTQGDSRQELLIRLHRAIPSEQRWRLFVRAHRRTPRLDEPLPGDILQIVEFRDLHVRESLVSLSAEPPLHMTLAGDEKLQRLDPLLLMGRSTERVVSLPESMLFLDRQLSKDWSVTVSREQPRFAAHVNQTVSVNARQVVESFELRCEPHQSFVSRILVQLSHRDFAPLEWNLVNAADSRLSPRLVSSPSEEGGHEVWELRLSRPLNRPFSITTLMQQPVGPQTNLTFASLPEAESQSGSLRVFARGGGPFDIRVRNLQPVAASLPEMQQLPMLRGMYRFSPSQEVAAAIEQLPANTLPAAAWIWQLQTDTRCDANGEMLHESRMYVENTGAAAITVRLPTNATIARVHVDHGLLPPAPVTAGLLSIPLPKERRFPLVSVVYRTSSHPLGIGVSIEPPVVSHDLACLESRARIWLPANFTVLKPAAGHAEFGTWDERLFGMRIWRRDAYPFDIFALDAWRSLGDSLRRAIGSLGTAARKPVVTHGSMPNHLAWTGVAPSVGPDEAAGGWQPIDIADNGGQAAKVVVCPRGLVTGMTAGIWLIAAGLAASLARTRRSARWPRLVWVLFGISFAVLMLVVPLELVNMARAAFFGALLGVVWNQLRPPPGTAPHSSESASARVSRSRGSIEARVPATTASAAAASHGSGLMLLIVSMAGAGAIGPHAVRGQETPAAPDTTINVLQPIDDAQQPKGDYLFVPQSLYDTIYRRANEVFGGLRGAWLESAEYHVTLRANGEGDARLVPRDFSADLGVRTFDSAAQLSVPWQRDRLRIVDVSLDGQSVVVQWNDAGDRFLVPLENGSTHRLRIVARPLQVVPELSGELVVPIASCPRSRLVVHAAGLIDRIDTPGTSGPLSRDDPTGEVAAALGPSTELRVRWKPPASKAQDQIETDVAELLWLHVQSHSLTLHGTFRFSARNGDLGQVAFLADRRLQLLPIDRDQPIASVDVQPGSQQTIRCWLDRPYSQVTVQLSFALKSDCGFGQWRVPYVTAQATHRVPTWIGVTVAEGRHAELLPRGTATDLAPSQFLSAWGDHHEPPHQAFALPPSSHELQISVRANPIWVAVQEQQDLLVTGDQAKYRYEAVVAADHGRLSHFRLAVPAQFEPQEITVLHDDANRLLRWSPVNAQELAIFFTTPLSGEFRLQVEGSVPVAKGIRVSLPLITASKASVRQRQANLFCGDDVQLELKASPGLRAEPRNTTRSDGGRFVASFTADEASVTPPSFELESKPNQPRVVGSLLTELSLREDRWQVAVDLHLEIQSGSIDAIRFYLPEELAGRIELVPPVQQQLYLAPGERGRLLVARLPAPVDREIKLKLIGELSLSADDPIRVPELRLLDVAEINRYIVLPTQFQRQKAVWETSGLQATEWPAQHAESTPPDDIAVYRVAGPRVQAELREVERLTGTPQVALTDYQIRWSHDRRFRGVATYYLQPSRLSEVKLSMPLRMKPVHFRVAGLPTVGRLTAPNQWLLAVGPELLPQLVEVLFEAELPSPTEGNGEFSFVAPTLVGISGDRTLWSVFGPSDSGGGVPGRIDLNELQPTLSHTVAEPSQLEQIRRETAESLRKRGLEDASQADPTEREAWRVDWDTRIQIIERRLETRLDPLQARSGSPPVEISSDLGGQWLAESGEYRPAVYCILQGDSPQFRFRFTNVSWRQWLARCARFLSLFAAVVGAVWFSRQSWFQELWRYCPHFVIAVAGLVWWLFFVPGLLGLALLLLAVLSALQPRWKRIPAG